MPLLDDRGRLFGRVNLIDAAVAAFVLLLIPLAYVGFLLFRAPTPVIASVEPATISGAKDVTVEVKGEHLRPFFRAYFGTTPVEYLFATPDRAVLKLPELPAGAYEVILYDEAQVVAKGPSVTVAPPVRVRDEPAATITVVGVFNRLKAHEAAALKSGLTLTVPLDPAGGAKDTMELLGVQPLRPAAIPLVDNSTAQVVEVEGRFQVTAVARLSGRSIARDLMFGDRKVAPGADLAVPVEVAAPATSTPAAAAAPGAAGSGTPPAAVPAAPAAPAPPTKTTLLFTVQKAYPGTLTPVDLRVRFITRPEILPSIQREVHPGGSRDPFLTLQPQVLSLRVTQELDGGSRLEQREGRITILDTMLRLPATRSADGWVYEGRPLKPGIELFVDTPNWQMSGIVLSMDAGANATR
jgi:hypothetical protein